MDKGVAMSWDGRMCVTPNRNSFFLLLLLLCFFPFFCILKLDEGDDRMTINIPKILIIHTQQMDRFCGM